MALQEEMEKQGQWLFKYRGTLPLIILAIGTILFVRSLLYPSKEILNIFHYEVYLQTFCLLVSFLGLAIRVFTVGHTPKNTSGRNVDSQLADSLNTTGIYSIVRHPLYLGNFFMWLGPALMTVNFWFIISFCFFYWVYYERIMFAEEQYLRGKFAKTYTDWAANVPAFIPRFKNYQSANLTFSWKKVLKKEKNGLVAVFLIFCLFDVLGEILLNRQDFNDFLIVGLAVSLVAYIILKYLKKYTLVLEEANR